LVPPSRDQSTRVRPARAHGGCPRKSLKTACYRVPLYGFRFKLRTLPEEQLPADVLAGDSEALAQLSEMEAIDYVVFGSVSSGPAERIVIQAAVWDRGANAIPVNEQETAFSLFETFHAADKLATRLLVAVSNQRSGFETVRLTTNERSERDRLAPGFAFFEPAMKPQPPVEPPRGGAEIETQVTATDGRPRPVMMRLQSGGGFLGAAGADFSPGNGLLRTGMVAGGTVLGDEATPAVAVAAAIEPTFGRLVTPVGVSSFLTADANAVTAAVGISLGLSVRFDRVIRELFFDNVIYFNAYPNAELPLVYLPALGVRL
jgi:hypothetical protein